MDETLPFRDVVRTVTELTTLYREPTSLVLAKTRPSLDEASAAFIARSTFVVLGTHHRDGTADVSPRGGPPGFVRVLDDKRLAIADLSGNNRLDSIRNVVETGRIGILAMVTGQDETVRINGRAWLTTDPELLDGFTSEMRRPKAAIGVEVDEVFVHCAMSLRRAGLWDPSTWRAADAPDGAAIFACQALVPELDEAGLRAALAAGYDEVLASERP